MTGSVTCEARPVASSKAVATNVKVIRERRGLTQQQLALGLREVGRPMQPTAVAKVEAGDRRVDVDDLTALAVVLNVPLARLLLPDTGEFDEVHVVPAYAVPAWDAWQWASGEQSLWRANDDGRDPEVQRRDLDFAAERPLWKRLHDEHPLARAARDVVRAVGRTLGSVRGAPRDRGEPPASGLAMESWVRRVEQALDRVRTELDVLTEGNARGQR